MIASPSLLVAKDYFRAGGASIVSLQTLVAVERIEDRQRRGLATEVEELRDVLYAIAAGLDDKFLPEVEVPKWR